MQANLNYFYQVTFPLRSHKSYDNQMDNLSLMQGNMTKLMEELELSKSQLDNLKLNMTKTAEGHF